MARIERAEPPVKVPVKKAVLIDPNAFTFKGAGKGLEVIGKVLTELGERKRDMQDKIGISNANAAMENAQREAAKELINTPFDKRAEVRQKWTAQAQSEIGLLNLSPDAMELTQNKVGIWADTVKDLGEIDDTELAAKEALTLTADDYGKALVEGSPEDIIESEAALNEVLSIQMTETEAKQFREKIEATALKQMEDNAIRIQKEKAVVAPKKTNDEVTAEIDARKKGKKPSGEFALISNKELESIRDYTKTIGEKQKTQSVQNLNAATVDAYDQIRDGEVDIDAMIDKNNADPAQTNEEKIKFANDIPTYFNKMNSTKTPDESNETVYDELTQMSEVVERGAESPSAFEKLYAENKHLLTKSDQRDIRSKDIVATKTMQNRTFSDALVIARPTLVELTEGDLGALKLARQNAEIIKDLPSINLFNIAIKKNQAQRWNLGRFRKELRSQIAQNPDWSQRQIFVAQEKLVEQLDIPDDKLLRAFDEQNPSSAIMAEPPDIVFTDIWQDLSANDRALIWSERMAGTPASVLLGSEEVLRAKEPKK